ncbi:MAG: hypothetical protein WCC12_12915 [Anaerolineales bacterium]
MLTSVTGALFVLHGLVHVLYAGQSSQFFELRRRMTWPDASWAFSKLFGDERIRQVGTIALTLTALGFVAGGLGLFLGQGWWRPFALGAALLSSVIFILLWDGKFLALPDQGLIGLLINLGILFVISIWKWPA